MLHKSIFVFIYQYSTILKRNNNRKVFKNSKYLYKSIFSETAWYIKECFFLIRDSDLKFNFPDKTISSISTLWTTVLFMSTIKPQAAQTSRTWFQIDLWETKENLAWRNKNTICAQLGGSLLRRQLIYRKFESVSCGNTFNSNIP